MAWDCWSFKALKQINPPQYPIAEDLTYRVGLLFQSHGITHGKEQICLVG
ncbi:hypothetical protein M2263_002492 [Providencia alcalifaciens]|nr:hypothetical protein [Providencia alcalifaciens]